VEKNALEELAKCTPASRAEFANKMLLACAEMLEYKLKTSGLGDERHLPEQRSLDIVAYKS
jgi:hypothetical protein